MKILKTSLKFLLLVCLLFVVHIFIVENWGTEEYNLKCLTTSNELGVEPLFINVERYRSINFYAKDDGRMTIRGPIMDFLNFKSEGDYLSLYENEVLRGEYSLLTDTFILKQRNSPKVLFRGYCTAYSPALPRSDF